MEIERNKKRRNQSNKSFKIASINVTPKFKSKKSVFNNMAIKIQIIVKVAF